MGEKSYLRDPPYMPKNKWGQVKDFLLYEAPFASYLKIKFEKSSKIWLRWNSSREMATVGPIFLPNRRQIPADASPIAEMATVGPKVVRHLGPTDATFSPGVRHPLEELPRRQAGIWRRLDQNASPLGPNRRHFSSRGEASFRRAT